MGLNPLIAPNSDLRCIHGPYDDETCMEDARPLPGRPAPRAPLNSSILERICFIVAAVAVYFGFPTLDFLPLPVALVVAVLCIPLLAEVMVQIAARLGFFP